MRRLLLLLGLTAQPAGAAAETQIWTEAGVDAELGARVSVSFEQHLRFDQDLSRVAAVMPEAGIDYRPLDWLQLGAGYRLAYERRRRGDMELRHRLHLQTQVRGDAGAFRIRYRLRLQERIRSEDLRHVVRNRLRVDYRGARPWTPLAAAELFHRLADEDPFMLRKLRLTAGLRRDLGEARVGLYYHVEIPYDEPRDPFFHIFGIEVHYSL
jgi:hypothetical protein